MAGIHRANPSPHSLNPTVDSSSHSPIRITNNWQAVDSSLRQERITFKIQSSTGIAEYLSTIDRSLEYDYI
jgi:hypothetical protein